MTTKRVRFEYIVLAGKGVMTPRVRLPTLKGARAYAKSLEPEWWMIRRVFLNPDGTFIRYERVDQWLGGKDSTSASSESRPVS